VLVDIPWPLSLPGGYTSPGGKTISMKNKVIIQREKYPRTLFLN